MQMQPCESFSSSRVDSSLSYARRHLLGSPALCISRDHVPGSCMYGADRFPNVYAFFGYHQNSGQDLSILLRFSLRFSRSTRLLCIFSSILANRSRSSLAARLVLRASARLFTHVSKCNPQPGTRVRTCLSDSFSSLSSFSLALVAANAFLSARRFSHED